MTPVSQDTESMYLFFYVGRYRTAVRVIGLAAITVGVALGAPGPSAHGHGLVILVSLVVAVATQLAVVVVPSRRTSTVRVVLGAVSGGLLVGYDPAVVTAILLALVGLDAGANMEFATGAVATGTAVVAVVLGNLASGLPHGNATLGIVAIAGFLAATTRTQFVLRAEEAELRLADVERAREEHARAANLAARANAAREIHDILAHSLGALVLQLDALQALLGGETPDPERSAEALTRARALAVDGLNEARRAVGSLRDDPPPLVDSLRQVVDTSGTGLLEITGTPRPVPSEAAVALRRTAQEGLTNAAKHAPGAVARVHLAFEPDEIVLTVSDGGRPDGVAPTMLAHTGGGYGIEGLRERAKLLGGSVHAGPAAGGWQTQLRVPDGQNSTSGEIDG